MNKVLRNFKLNLFTFIEIVFAFTVITIVLSIDLGYAYQLKSGIDGSGSAGTLYIFNAFTMLAVFVTVLGIMGIQLIQIYRRTREIGLHKAVGARDSDIAALILKDTLLIILVPALVGIGAGVLLASAIPFGKLGLQASINIQLIALSFAGILIFTCISGFFPAFKAVQMNPADVLRKHGITKTASGSNKYGKVLLLIAAVIIIAGTYINYSLEAEYKKDILNSSGTPPATTEAVPEFSFKNNSGEVISSQSLKNKGYCLLIWDTGCPVSIGVMNELNRLITENKIKNSDVYAISLDESLNKVEKYISDNNLSLNSYTDYKKSVKWAFKANILPVLYIVNKDGIISARVLGWSDTMKEYMLRKLAEEV